MLVSNKSYNTCHTQYIIMIIVSLLIFSRCILLLFNHRRARYKIRLLILFIIVLLPDI